MCNVLTFLQHTLDYFGKCFWSCIELQLKTYGYKLHFFIPNIKSEGGFPLSFRIVFAFKCN